ncbi:MAG: hypothetical protein ACRDF6_03095 [bacterium]
MLLLILVLALLSAPALAAAPRTLELRASEVTVEDGGRVIDARGAVRITDGRNRVRADRAVYTVRDRRIELTGAVSVVGEEGTLDAARALIRLTGDRQIDMVDARGAVKLQTRGRILRASRVSYTVGADAVSASGNVSLSMPPAILATGQSLVVRRTTMTLTGSARVQNQDGSIRADRLEFVEGEQVAYARGNVTAVFQETRITSSAATFYGGERKAVFRDGVTVTRPGRTMKAQVVTVFYESRRIVAEGETNITFDEERREP